MQFSQSGGDLARRPALTQLCSQRLEQRVVGHQLGRRAGLSAAPVAALLGKVAAVVGAGLVTHQFAANGGCSIPADGQVRWSRAGGNQVDCNAVVISCDTLLGLISGVLHFEFERAL